MNDLVNNKHSVAILAAGAPIADAALASSAASLKVPVVGGDLNSALWNTSPWLFGQGGSAIPTYAGAVKAAAQAKGGGAHKAGLLYCVEANICGYLNQNWPQITKWAGVTKGISKAISITQTDFTAECQALKNDGDDIIFAGMDGSAVSRVARSCASIGYYPPIGIPGIAVNAAVAQDAGIQKDTAFFGSAVAPFTTKDTQAGKEFNDEAAQYAPGQKLDPATNLGWAAGKLFEAALSHVATEARSGPITTALVLKGLGMVKNETLGGYSPPLSFTAGAAHPALNCYFPISLTTKGFGAPQGGKLSCFS
jgi:branched-chain amino acid transport system substrate-binding protein